MWQAFKGLMGSTTKAVTGFAYWKWVGIAVLAVVILVIATVAWSRGVKLEREQVRVTAMQEQLATLTVTLEEDRRVQDENYATLEKALALSGEAVESCLDHVRVTERDKAALRAMNRSLQERLDERATAKLEEQQALFVGACSKWAAVPVCDDADGILQRSTRASGAWPGEGSHGALGPGDRADAPARGAHGTRAHAPTTHTNARMRAQAVYWAAGDVAWRHGRGASAGESDAGLHRGVGSIAWR